MNYFCLSSFPFAVQWNMFNSFLFYFYFSVHTTHNNTYIIGIIEWKENVVLLCIVFLFSFWESRWWPFFFLFNFLSKSSEMIIRMTKPQAAHTHKRICIYIQICFNFQWVFWAVAFYFMFVYHPLCYAGGIGFWNFSSTPRQTKGQMCIVPIPITHSTVRTRVCRHLYFRALLRIRRRNENLPLEKICESIFKPLSLLVSIFNPSDTWYLSLWARVTRKMILKVYLTHICLLYILFVTYMYYVLPLKCRPIVWKFQQQKKRAKWSGFPYDTLNDLNGEGFIFPCLSFNNNK